MVIVVVLLTIGLCLLTPCLAKIASIHTGCPSLVRTLQNAEVTGANVN